MIEAADQAGVILTHHGGQVRLRTTLTPGPPHPVIGDPRRPVLFGERSSRRADMSGRWNADRALPAAASSSTTAPLGGYRPLLPRAHRRGQRAWRASTQAPRSRTLSVFLRSVEDVIGSIDLSWSMDKSLGPLHRHLRHGGEIRDGGAAPASGRWRAPTGSPFGRATTRSRPWAARAELLPRHPARSRCSSPPRTLASGGGHRAGLASLADPGCPSRPRRRDGRRKAWRRATPMVRR